MCQCVGGRGEFRFISGTLLSIMYSVLFPMPRLLRGRADPNAVLGALRRTPLFAAAERCLQCRRQPKHTAETAEARCNIKLIDSLLKFRADVNRADLAGGASTFA